VHYFDQRVRAKVEMLRTQYSPGQFVKEADKVRRSLRASYLMPNALWDGQSRLIRETTIDELPVEVRCLRILPGVYSVLRIYRPRGGSGGRHPTVLYLPGHGDPAWDPGVQKRLLGFAKQGYVAVTPDPFGQGELTDTPFWNEYHGCGAMAHLLTAGESLLGMIMASHGVELSYLRSRSDVNPDQLVVMGGSMGGTHALWLSAIDERIKGVVAVSAAPALDPSWNLRMHCLCDSMVGAYHFADGETVRSLIAPRPLLVIYPDLEAPMSDEGAMLLNEGKLDFMNKAAKSKYFLTDQQMANLYPFAREVYRRKDALDRFKEAVVIGPHGDAQRYRELAYGWFARFLLGKGASTPLAEASLSPIVDPPRARTALAAWQDGRRPDDFVGPTEYTRRAISALVAKLPEPPASPDDARRLGAELRQSIGRLLGVSQLPRDVRFSKEGDLEIEGTTAAKYAVEPEPGVLVPMLVFKPTPGVKPDGSLHVLLAPQGVRATAGSPDRKRLADGGSWVVCADLRGMGSTYGTQAAYAGLRDQPLCVGALKLGETAAGWWTIDLLAVVEAARKIVGSRASVIVRGSRETGLVAILAAGQSQSINAVDAEGLLASYYSSAGYGFPYVYGDAGGHNADLGVYGSMVPCIPNILKLADIVQLAAMVCPRPLTITDPLWADGKAVSTEDTLRVFAWARRFYEVSGCQRALIFHSRGTVERSPSP
jgi:acetyl esterase/lipase